MKMRDSREIEVLARERDQPRHESKHSLTIECEVKAAVMLARIKCLCEISVTNEK